MTSRMPAAVAAVLVIAWALAGTAHADGIGSKAKNAIDPDCNVAKAARGAATKAVVGVRGNRCGVAETTRDTLGIDGRGNSRDKDGDGPLERRRDN
jgi:hypothetical protein